MQPEYPEPPKRAMVVHCRRAAYDVYVGRGCCPETGKPGDWGNPFHVGAHGNREEVIAKFKAWLLTQRDLLLSLPWLYGKVLGCWCAPSWCHGDILVEWAGIAVRHGTGWKKIVDEGRAAEFLAA